MTLDAMQFHGPVRQSPAENSFCGGCGKKKRVRPNAVPDWLQWTCGPCEQKAWEARRALSCINSANRSRFTVASYATRCGE